MSLELRFEGVDIADDTQALRDKVPESWGRIAKWRGAKLMGGGCVRQQED